MTIGSRLVVLATDSTVPSGVGEHMLTLARALASEHDVSLCFVPDGDGPRFLHRGAAEGFETVALDGSFAGWLQHRQPAILHVHAGIGWEGHKLVEAGRNAGVPVVRTEHLPYLLTDPDQISSHRTTVGLADTLVVVSDAAADSYRSEGFAHVITVRNGIDMPVAQRTRDQICATLSIPDEARIIITVARFTAQKGHEWLLSAANEVARQMPHAVFLLVGDGPERESMQALATSLDLRNVVFLGERADVPDLLAAAELFCLPSLFEGLPLAILEAMALALPIVATRIGGTIEALGSDHPYLAPPGDSSALAATIVAALVDRPASRGVGIKEQERFQDLFTAARMGRQMSALYRATTERRQLA